MSKKYCKNGNVCGLQRLYALELLSGLFSKVKKILITGTEQLELKWIKVSVQAFIFPFKLTLQICGKTISLTKMDVCKTYSSTL